MDRQAEAAVRHAHANGFCCVDGQAIQTHSWSEAAKDRGLWKRLVRNFVSSGGTLA